MSNTVIFLPREPYTNGNAIPDNNNIIRGCAYTLRARLAKAKKWGYKFGFVFKEYK